MMQLRISKNTDKPHVIGYKRDDGSETWTRADEFFVLHDLSHYAIEKTLGYTTAFMGMLNGGVDIKDFEDRNKRKAMRVTAEGASAENMANLFLMEVSQGETEDFNQVLADSFVKIGGGETPVRLSPDQLDAIRSFYRRLLAEWAALPAGQTMILEF
jgi:hypothetical protein